MKTRKKTLHPDARAVIKVDIETPSSSRPRIDVIFVVVLRVAWLPLN